MIHALTATLKNILGDQRRVPEIVHSANVTFERPAELFAPGATTINMFLYDIRENTELRNNEPGVERRDGLSIIHRPPLRLDCSYQITVWVDSSLSGEQASLSEHELLSEVVKVFTKFPIIEDKYLRGNLIETSYPIPLKIAQADLIRSPAEFWSALGGKLKPSITITATISLDQDVKPVEFPIVSSKKVALGEKKADSNEYKNSEKVVAEFEIAGVVTDIDTGVAVDNVELTLVEVGKSVVTDKIGHYRFGRLKQGKYEVRIEKLGYATLTQVIPIVSGSSPSAFNIKLKRSST